MTVCAGLPTLGSFASRTALDNLARVVCDVDGNPYPPFALIWVGNRLGLLNSFCPHPNTGQM